MSHTRQSSVESGFSSPTSPGMTPLDSSASLILVHDSDEATTPFEFDDDSDDENESLDVRGIALSPSSVFLYLLSPYLKMSALLLPNTGLSIKVALPSFLLFAILSLFSRQIWFMLGRYTHKPDLEDVILDAFARGRNKERTRQFLRFLVRSGTVLFRILLAAVYLRQSVSIVLPFLPDTDIGTRLLLTVPCVLLVISLSGAQSSSAKSVLYATSASIATYVIWFILVTSSYVRGTLKVQPEQISSMGLFWQGITTTAFTFTTSATLSLYTSLKGTSIPGTKTSRSRSFNTLASLASAVAISLLLPLAFFSAFPKPPNASEPPALSLEPYIAAFGAMTLLLSIPSILITTPTIPTPPRMRRSIPFSLSKAILFVAIVGLSLVPARLARVLADILIVGSLLGTYFLPALIHITTHHFKRPLSIVIPPAPNQATSAFPSSPSHITPFSDSPLASSGPSSQAPDELLLNKERSLQSRQRRRRIIWDIGVWVLLVPIGGGGTVWAAGVLLGKW